MKTVTKEIYKCDHCGKQYQEKLLCERHEQRCVKNPENHRPCFNCRFLTERYEGVLFPIQGDMQVCVDTKVLFCSKKQQFLYPPIAKNKRDIFDVEYFESMLMPKECNLHKLVGM